MTQNVAIVATNELDNTITLLVSNTRVEYFLGNRYWTALNKTREALASGWGNFAVKNLTVWAHKIEHELNRSPNQEDTSSMTDFKSSPSKEYSWTVIASTAKTLTYTNGRKWFKTDTDARMFAGEIFELEKNARGGFDLAIVRCEDVVKPKPQIELISNFKESS